MHILLSNDDGYQALGINTLRKHLLQSGHRVTLIAPDRNRSACSSLLTVTKPLLPVQVSEDIWYVKDGTPADCVHLALGGLFDFVPDMVCAGINDCANLGDDTIYSGTVAAVIEARHQTMPKIAFSLDGDGMYEFETAANIAVNIIEKVHEQQIHTLLNVNIPAITDDQIKGWRITRLGARVKSSPITPKIDAAGNTRYAIGQVGRCKDDRVGTDFEALEQGYISITPLQTDLTDFTTLHQLENLIATVRPLH